MRNHEPDHLTPREREVLCLLAKGLTNRQIAEQLDVHRKTIACHISNILQKLAVENRWQAVLEANKRGWVEIESD